MKSKVLFKDVLNIPVKGCFLNYQEFTTYQEFIEYLLTKWKGKEYILGCGTNTLPKRVRAKTKVIKVKENIVNLSTSRLIVSSNVITATINSRLKKEGFSNFMGVCTIPGTIGAGIKGNATYLDKDFFNGLESIIVYDNNGFEKILAKDIKRSYRKTDIQGIILFAIYNLVKEYDNKKEKYYLSKRKNQPKGIFSLGSTFKNPTGYKAYELIKAVIENKKDFFMSSIHYNFLDIKKNDNPLKIYKSLEKIRKLVKKRFNINLEYEIKIIE